MPAHRTLATLLLILAGATMSASLRAAELKDIGQQIRQGRYADALGEANTYLASHPADAQAMFLKGVALTELNKPDEAIAVFTEITHKYPYLPEPYNNLAVLYAGKGQYDKAKTALENALKTHPSYATAHNNLADVYAHMASEAYDKALQLEPGSGSNRTQTNRLALIQDLPTTVSGKPLMLAAKPVESRIVPTEAPRPPEPPKMSEPPLPVPVKPVEQPRQTAPAKQVEPSKPPVSVAKVEPKPAEPVKPVPPPAAANETSTAANRQQDEKEIKEAVQSWALAWSAQNVEKYLSSYADSFKTPNGESRTEWQKTRRDRLTSPSSIKVGVSNLRVTMKDAEHAQADFKQAYQAGSTVMRTSKTLILKRAGGKWLIEQERTGR